MGSRRRYLDSLHVATSLSPEKHPSVTHQFVKAIGEGAWINYARDPITPPMSIRFGAFFGQSDKYWHGIQCRVRLPQVGGGQEPTDCQHSTSDGGRSPAWRPPRRSTRDAFWSTVTTGNHKRRGCKNSPQLIDALICAAPVRWS